MKEKEGYLILSFIFEMYDRILTLKKFRHHLFCMNHFKLFYNGCKSGKAHKKSN